MSKKNKKILIGICLFVMLSLIAAFSQNDKLISYVEKNYNIDFGIEKDGENQTANTEEYKVVRVVDGDTIVVNFNGKEEKVRFIGVDTPESVHPDKSKNTEEGVRASEYTKERLLNKNVKLEFDVQERDKYGRLLAYVYIEGNMYNKELLEKGYAKVATYPPNVKYVDEFKELQKNARVEKMGIWK